MKKYSDEIWEDCSKNWFLDKEFTDKIIRIIISNKPKKVLDVGCGAGYYVRELRKRKIDTLGIDMSEKAISQAPKPYCAVGDALNLKFKSNYFDFVFAVLLISHVNDRNISIREMKRVLKKDGKLLLVFPNKKSIVSLYTIFSRMKTIHNTFTLDDIKEYLQSIGFDVICTEYLFIGKYKHKILQLIDAITPQKNAEDILIVAKKR